MCTVALTYVLISFFVTDLYQIISKRGVVFIGLVLAVSGIMTTGIIVIGSFHSMTFFIITGLAGFGFGFALVTIPILPEMLDGIEESKKIIEEGPYDYESLTNNISGYFIVSQAIGETVGPLLSTLIRSNLSFRITQYLLGAYTILLLIFYVLFCGRSQFFSRKEPNKI